MWLMMQLVLYCFPVILHPHGLVLPKGFKRVYVHLEMIDKYWSIFKNTKPSINDEPQGPILDIFPMLWVEADNND